MAENSVLCGEFRALCCPVFSHSSCSTSLSSLTSLSQDYEKYYVSSNNTEWECEWTSTRRLVTNPVTGRRTSTGRPVTVWNVMRKGVTGKEFTLTSWKAEIAKCRRARTTWTLCWKRTGEAIPRAAKIGRIHNSRAQRLNRDLWIRRQSPIRYRGTKFVERSLMKQNFSRPTSWNLA